MSPRRRSRYGMERKPIAMESYYVAAISGVSLIVFFISMVLSIYSNGNIGNIMAGIAMVAFISSIICLIIGVRFFRSRSYTTFSRMIGLFVPLISVLLWIVVYAIGLLII